MRYPIHSTLHQPPTSKNIEKISKFMHFFDIIYLCYILNIYIKSNTEVLQRLMDLMAFLTVVSYAILYT